MAKKKDPMETIGNHGVVIQKEDGHVDVLRDALWVYQRLAKLVKRSGLGVITLDKDLLGTAPSNGAVSMAEYAAVYQKEFFATYVNKLLVNYRPPKGRDDEDDLDDDPDVDQDPDLDDLQDLVGGLG